MDTTKGFEITLNKRLFVKLCNYFNNLITSDISLIESHEAEAETDDYWRQTLKEAHEEIQLAQEALKVLYED